MISLPRPGFQQLPEKTRQTRVLPTACVSPPRFHGKDLFPPNAPYFLPVSLQTRTGVSTYTHAHAGWPPVNKPAQNLPPNCLSKCEILMANRVNNRPCHISIHPPTSLWKLPLLNLECRPLPRRRLAMFGDIFACRSAQGSLLAK